MKNIFNSVLLKKPKSNYFDLTHDVKMSGRIGELMPCLVLDCVPGDRFNIGADHIARFAPLYRPVMHRFDITIHYFFVPNRIIWPNWETFITDANAMNGNPQPVLPHYKLVDLATPEQKRICDYLGIPPDATGTGIDPTWTVNALPFAAYNKIWAEYYRDQNLTPFLNPGVDPSQFGTILQDGSNPVSHIKMHNRAYEHDYFTSSLPWAQKGAEVVIPFNTTDMRVFTSSAADQTITSAPTNQQVNTFPDNNPDIPANQLFASVAEGREATEPSINDLRRAFRLQEWLEKNARGGSRYIESILSHFGVRSSDKRLNRPEYIAGVKSPMVVSEVLNTTGQVGGIEQGQMAGHGVSVAGGKSGSYYCEEHGLIMGIVSVMPKPAYSQGIPRYYIKNDRLDWFWPSFAHLGEQPVQNQEIYSAADQTDPYGTFGYVPRYAEYKYMPNRIQGEFRTTLSDWHASRIFDAPPVLNEDFISCKPEDVARIFNVTDPNLDTVFMQILHKIGANRLMPKYGTPTI